MAKRTRRPIINRISDGVKVPPSRIQYADGVSPQRRLTCTLYGEYLRRGDFRPEFAFESARPKAGVEEDPLWITGFQRINERNLRALPDGLVSLHAIRDYEVELLSGVGSNPLDALAGAVAMLLGRDATVKIGYPTESCGEYLVEFEVNLGTCTVWSFVQKKELVDWFRFEED